MNIYLDTANVKDIKEAVSQGSVDGITTNPSLAAKEGRNFKELLLEICNLVDGPISAEVISVEARRFLSMGMIDHWHPVLAASDLSAQPVGVRLAGTGSRPLPDRRRAVGALSDNCPHRRMRLSLGKVDRRQAPVPLPRLDLRLPRARRKPRHARSSTPAPTHFDVREKPRGHLGQARRRPTPSSRRSTSTATTTSATSRTRVKAPLELVVDNFCEIEHTPTTHAFFGYPLERMHEVEVRVRADRHQRPRHQPRPAEADLGRSCARCVGIGRDYQFMDDWTTHFSPVYSVYDHWWQ